MRRRTPLLALASCILVSGLAVSATADDRDELVRQREENTVQLEDLRAHLEGTEVELQDTYLALEATRQQVPIAQAELRLAEENLAAAERVQQQTADRLAVAEAELAKLGETIAHAEERTVRSREALGELARTTYQNGATLSAMSLVVGSGSSGDFATRMSAVDSAVRVQTAVLAEMSELEATARNAQERQEAVTVRVTELKEQADQAVVAADAARDAAAQKQAELLSLQARQESLAADLEGRRTQIEAQQTLIRQANEELAREIARIDEENRRRAEEERLERLRQEELRRQQELEAQRLAQQQAAEATTDTSRSEPVRPPAPTFAIGTPVPPPLYVTSPYGYRIYPITGGWFFHPGVDLRSKCGNRQYSVAGGTVADLRLEYNNGTHGNQVIINHGMINGSSYVSVYNHLSGFAVREGQAVSKGQVIGYTGTTGASTGCHVHLEIWKNGATIDPMSLPAY